MQTFTEMAYGGTSSIYWDIVLYVERCLSLFVSQRSCRPGLAKMWPAGRIPNSSIIHFNKHNRSTEHKMGTLLADKMLRNYNSSILRQHTEKQLLFVFYRIQ